MTFYELFIHWVEPNGYTRSEHHWYYSESELIDDVDRRNCRLNEGKTFDEYMENSFVIYDAEPITD